FLSVCLFIMFFFFFQAEDGIRDFHVTGVQTCALPISIIFPSSNKNNRASGMFTNTYFSPKSSEIHLARSRLTNIFLVKSSIGILDRKSVVSSIFPVGVRLFLF